MDRVIITGTNGFIGHYVTERITSEGYKVYSIDLGDYRTANENVTSFSANLSKTEEVGDVLGKIGNASAMIHLAADISVPGDSTTVGNNVSGMLGAIEIAKKAGAEHFVYLSSIPVIGTITKKPIDESHPVRPLTPYHWSKYIGEKVLTDHNDVFKTVTIIRIPSPIGAGMRKSVFLPMMLQKMINGEDVEIYGKGTRVQNYIDVRDIAETMFKVIKERPDGLYLISGDESISNMSLAQLCRKIVGSDISILSGIHEDPQDPEEWIISSKKAKDSFGFSPKYDIESSVRRIYEDMK